MKCEPKLTEDYINRILSYLQGWTLDAGEPLPQREYATSFLEEVNAEDAIGHVNTTSREEVALFFQKAKNEVKSYLWTDYIPYDPVVHEGLIQWTAGLLWKKYNVKNYEFVDKTAYYGYGDQLIAYAKKTMKNKVRTRLRGLI